MEKINRIKEEINRVIKGKEEVVEMVLAAIVAGGHILMDDIPGVGKTTMATSFAKVLSLDYKRVQFTPDVLPSDLLGFSMYNGVNKTFEYREGAVFCNLFLADEINRTSPKTQSALLEVMEERQVSVEGETKILPDPFIVIATQNPFGSSGTQLLPDSQMDRFMVCLSMGYPSHEDAVEILKNKVWDEKNELTEILSLEELKELQDKAKNMYVHDELYEYIVTLTEKTRTSELFSAGASPRASIALLHMSKAYALVSGRDFVVSEDVQKVAVNVFKHRVKISARAKAEGLDVERCIERMIIETKSPRN